MEVKEITEKFSAYQTAVDKIAGEFKGMQESYKTVAGNIADYQTQNKDLLDAVADIQTKIAKGAVSGKSDVWSLAEVKAIGDYMKKAMYEGSGPAGGYLVPPVMANNIISRLTDMDEFRKIAGQITIGGSLAQIPIEADLAATSWVGEIEPRPDTAAPKLGIKNVPIDTVIAHVPISYDLLQDGIINVEQYAVQKCTEALARAEGAKFINGDGAKGPEGVFVCDEIPTVKTGAAANITADGLIDLWGAVPSAADANGSYIMNKTSATTARKFKDSQGQYLFQQPLAAGMPPTFNGFPIHIMPSAPSASAGAKPVAFGDFRNGYLIVDRADVTIIRDPYTLKNQNQVDFLFSKRVGGAVVQPTSLAINVCGV